MKKTSCIVLGSAILHWALLWSHPASAEDLFTGNTVSVNYDNNQCYPNGRCMKTAYVHTYRFTKDGSLFSYRRDGGGVHFRPKQKSSSDKSTVRANGHTIPVYTKSTYSISGNRFKIRDVTRFTYTQESMPQLPVARGDALQTIDVHVKIDGRKCTVVATIPTITDFFISSPSNTFLSQHYQNFISHRSQYSLP